MELFECCRDRLLSVENFRRDVVSFRFALLMTFPCNFTKDRQCCLVQVTRAMFAKWLGEHWQFTGQWGCCLRRISQSTLRFRYRITPDNVDGGPRTAPYWPLRGLHLRLHRAPPAARSHASHSVVNSPGPTRRPSFS